MFFQVFHLTALVVRGPLDLPAKFIVCLDWVMIDYQDAQRAIAYAENFLRNPLFA